MFELNHLRCFVTLADELHFGRAAKRLAMTQPPLSRQIQQLEHILNVKLFERSSRSVYLTPAGAAFAKEARLILSLAEGAVLSTKQIASGTSGAISIGFTGTAGYSLLPRLLASMRRENPNVQVTLKELVTREQIDALSSGRIDVGILHPPLPREGSDGFLIGSEPLLCALWSTHRLAEKQILTMEDLHDETLIGYSPFEARYYHDILNVIFHRHGMAYRCDVQLSQVHSILGLVQAELGIALVPRPAEALNFRNVVLRPVQDIPSSPLKHYMAWEKDNQNPACKTLIALARKEFRKLES